MFITAIVLSSISLHKSTQSIIQLQEFLTLKNETTLYVDPIVGHDSPNGGQTIDDPLASLQQALINLNQGTNMQCTIVLLSTITLSETISMFPATRQCKHISITAPRKNIHNDVVTLTTPIQPNSYNWTSITLQTGGIIHNFYQRRFVENLAQQRIYVVESNTATTVDSIAGYVDEDAPLRPFDEPNNPNAWEVGDQLELFDLDVSIQWTGALLMDLPYNTVTFSNLMFLPMTSTSYIRFPDTEDQVHLRGCRLDCRATQCFRGAVSLTGVYATSDNNSTYFYLDINYDNCPRFESVWLDRINLSKGGLCSTMFLKANDAFSALESDAGGILIGYSLKYENGNGLTLFINAPTRIFLHRLYITKNAGGTSSLAAFSVDNGGSIVMNHVEIECVLPFCSIGIIIGKQCKLDLRGEVSIYASRTMQTFTNGVLHVNNPKSFRILGAGSTSSFLFSEMSIGIFEFYQVVSNISTTSGTFGLIRAETGSTVVLRGPSSNYYWATPSNGVLVAVRYRGIAIDETTGGGMNIQRNKGPVSTRVIQCGLLAVSTWTTSQRSTDNSMCTRV